MFNLRVSPTYRIALSWGILALTLAARPASATVTEPNGLTVPQPAPANEIPLQQYFDSVGEGTPGPGLNATTDASATPGTFSPLCTFQAELVLSQAMAAAGLAWYNVPQSPTAAPDAVYVVVQETTTPGAMIASAAIRSDPNYTGGLVGFALMENGVAVYYSEYKRNVFCSACTSACTGCVAMPDYWKMMLAYPSKLDPSSTYYLAFEDWAGAGTTGWPDDGDFNDKVFKLVGVRCPGGGDACDTGKPGVCGPGITECESTGITCKQTVPEKPEICDNLDNDCNGMVDDGDLCQAGFVCEHGTCVRGCTSGEFRCTGALVCDSGHCVDPKCVGVMCDLGKVCREGACVAPCDDVVCPTNQVCRYGTCVDPCDGVACDGTRICRDGVCVEKCDCGGCPATLACSPSGACVDPGCESASCATGTVCSKGTCVDPCTDAKCPGGAACVAGTCLPPPTPPPMDAGAPDASIIIIGGTSTGSTGSVSGGNVGTASSTGSAATTTTTTAGAEGGTSGGIGSQANGVGSPDSSGCSCRVPPRTPSSSAALFALLGLGALLAARRLDRNA